MKKIIASNLILLLFIVSNLYSASTATISITFTFKGKVIGIDGGEIVSTTDSKTKIVVPKNILTENRTFYLDASTNPSTNANEQIVLTYEVRVENPTTKENITDLGGSIAITLHTTLNQLGQIDTNMLALGYWNGASWVALDSTVRMDGNDVYVDASTSRISKYAIMVKTGEYTKKIGKDGGEMNSTTDLKTKIVVPKNLLKEDKTFSVDLVSEPSTKTDEQSVVAYEITAKDVATNKAIRDLGGSIRIVLHATKTQIGAKDINMLAIGYWDGLHWVPLGSKVTVDGNDVYVETTTTHLSIYGIITKKTSSVGLTVTPNPFTPAASRYNIIYFNFNNEGNEDVEIKIWDITGVLVKKITISGGNSVSWDGKNDYGDVCEAGVYVYQLKVGNARVGKGTIVVAK